MDIIIFYHANCADGFGAAFAAWLRFGESERHHYVPVSYGQPIPLLANYGPGPYRVYIVDFSWPAADLMGLASLDEVDRVVVLDHHTSAQRELAAAEHPKLMVHFSTTRSGAVMAWRFFQDLSREVFDREPLREEYFAEAEIPEMIRMVEDYDIHWPPLHPETRALHAGLWQGRVASFPEWRRVLTHWGHLTEGTRWQLLVAGQAILFANRLSLLRIVKQVQHITGPHGELGLAVNSPVMPNEIAEHLLAEHPLAEFVAVFYQRADFKWKVSLRSRQGGCDVAKIAERQGGGGHQSAAAFVQGNLDAPWK